MILRIFASVVPRQSSSSSIFSSINAVADSTRADFFMFISTLSLRQRDQDAVRAPAGVACRRSQKKYESPQSTQVAAAQLQTSGPSPSAKWATSAEARVMAKPAYAHSLSRDGTGASSSTTPMSLAQESSTRK